MSICKGLAGKNTKDNFRSASISDDYVFDHVLFQATTKKEFLYIAKYIAFQRSIYHRENKQTKKNSHTPFHTL